jgi:hypothetical protein
MPSAAGCGSQLLLLLLLLLPLLQLLLRSITAEAIT